MSFSILRSLSLTRMNFYRPPVMKKSLFHSQKIFITGANGDIGGDIIEYATSQYQRKVIGFARKKMDIEHELFTNVLVTDSDLQEDRLVRIFEKYVNPDERILFINAIGSAHPKRDQSFKAINYDIPLAVFKAIKIISIQYNIEVKFVHLSSIAASLLKMDGYAVSRQQFDQVLLSEPDTLKLKILCLRVGYVVKPNIPSHIHGKGKQHEYRAEEIAQFPTQPIIREGKQIVQPVLSKDLIRAIFNFAESSHMGNRCVDAVGDKCITQLDFVKFFCEVHGKKFRPFMLHPEEFANIARNFSRGHIATYVCEYLALDNESLKLDHKNFESLVGRRLTTLDDTYNMHGKEIYRVSPWPTAFMHGKDIFLKIWNREVDIDCVKQLCSFGLRWVISWVK